MNKKGKHLVWHQPTNANPQPHQPIYVLGRPWQWPLVGGIGWCQFSSTVNLFSLSICAELSIELVATEPPVELPAKPLPAKLPPAKPMELHQQKYLWIMIRKSHDVDYTDILDFAVTFMDNPAHRNVLYLTLGFHTCIFHNLGFYLRMFIISDSTHIST